MSSDHSVGVNEMVLGSAGFVALSREPVRLDHLRRRPYACRHIRPLVVGPLDHPERVPRPWGFFISGAARADGARS